MLRSRECVEAMTSSGGWGAMRHAANPISETIASRLCLPFGVVVLRAQAHNVASCRTFTDVTERTGTFYASRGKATTPSDRNFCRKSSLDVKYRRPDRSAWPDT